MMPMVIEVVWGVISIHLMAKAALKILQLGGVTGSSNNRHK
jgi:hypothetical protein